MTLVKSILKWNENSKITILVLDDDAKNYIQKIKNDKINIINIQDLIFSYPELNLAQSNRQRHEFIFTLTPFIIDFVLSKSQSKQIYAIYLDADTYFFSNPNGLMPEIVNFDICLTPHRYSQEKQLSLLKYGFFNVGLLAFKGGAISKEALNWWKNKCLEWCLDFPINGKFAEQGYLNEMAQIFSGVKIINHPGINMAPWNDTQIKIETLDKKVLIDEKYELLLYHFQGLSKFMSHYYSNHEAYGNSMREEVRELIYKPYVRELELVEQINREAGAQISKRTIKRGKGFKKYLIRLRKQYFLLRKWIMRKHV
jgi:hypothetical protein